MNDNELFGLCKEVYKRFPEWQTGKWLFDIHTKGKDGEAPEYTSDYLLEKLPKTIDSDDSILYLTVYGDDIVLEDEAWVACYELYDSDKHNVKADTPLKALLKLTIALDDAGVKL